MYSFVDLHTHSTASDGSMSPRELVRHAADLGLKAIALTDHDTLDGIADALDEGEKNMVEVIPGVEISALFKPEMHILGYFSSKTYKNLAPVLSKLKSNRDERNPKIIKKLNELGFDITMEEVGVKALGAIVGRPHIAKVMMEKGYVKSIDEAFEKYLASGKPAYFKKDKLTPYEAIKEILDVGGVPVLAHPVHIGMNINKLDILLKELTEFGLRGIEAYYVDNSDDDTGIFLRLAIKYGIIATGGSDFHGSFKPDIELGKGRGKLSVGYEAVLRLKEAMRI